jgi:hypothetical protein
MNKLDVFCHHVPILAFEDTKITFHVKQIRVLDVVVSSELLSFAKKLHWTLFTSQPVGAHLELSLVVFVNFWMLFHLL